MRITRTELDAMAREDSFLGIIARAKVERIKHNEIMLYCQWAAREYGATIEDLAKDLPEVYGWGAFDNSMRVCLDVIKRALW